MDKVCTDRKGGPTAKKTGAGEMASWFKAHIALVDLIWVATIMTGG